MLRPLVIRCAEAATRLARGGQRLLVLIYHRVLPDPDPMYPHEPDVAAFRGQMQALRQDFRVLDLGEALQRLARGRLPARAVAVTFDDGFADNLTQALPVLREQGLTATFFIATGYLGHGCMFNDAVIEACRRAPAGVWATGTPEFGDLVVESPATRPLLAERIIARIKYAEAGRRAECAAELLASAGASAPRGLMMSHDQLRQLHAAGMAVGAHTRNHPILARLDDGAAEREIAVGRAELRDLTGARIELFAYPNGRPGQDYGARDVALVRKLGFTGAVSTARGFADRSSDPLQVPRVGNWGSSLWRFSGRLALARARARGQDCTSPAGGRAVS